MNPHTHPSSQANCEVPRVRAGIKQSVTETVMKIQQILPEQLAKISEGAAINLPVLENIHSALQEKDLPPSSMNIAVIPNFINRFQTTAGGDWFLMFDSVAGTTNWIPLNLIIRADMGLLKFTCRFCTSCTFFIWNKVVEFFRASLF